MSTWDPAIGGRRDFDQHVGGNISKFRGAMSQQDLAEAMRKDGFKWSQATVWSIEKGERPLRLSEAIALTRILKRGLAHFLTVNRQEADLKEAVWTTRNAGRDVANKVDVYLDAQANLRHALSAAQSSLDSDEMLTELERGGLTYWVDEALRERERSYSDYIAEEMQQKHGIDPEAQ